MPSSLRVGTLALVAIGLIAAAGCGDARPAADVPADAVNSEPAEVIDSAWFEALAALAGEIPGIDEVAVDYTDPDGNVRDALPDDPDNPADWTGRIHLVHDIRGGSGWAADTVARLVASRPSTPPVPNPHLEIWLHPVALAEVSVLAYPPADSGDPVRAAYLMGATPGVVRAVFDGTSGEVRVRDGSDLRKVADVAVAHGVQVNEIRTADGSSALDITSVPARPPRVTVDGSWPDDPAAAECTPADVRLSIAGTDAATGHRALVVAATNIDDRPCAVEGYPYIEFRSIDERPLDVTVQPGRSFMADDPGPQRIVIPSGARALAVAGWNAVPTAEYPEGGGQWPDVTAEIVLGLGTVAPVELPLTSFALPPEELQEMALWQPVTTLDIVDGGEVSMTAWAPDNA